MLVLLYAVNSLFAYLLLTPIRLGLSRALDHRLTPDTINFTLLSDLLSNQSLLLNGQLGLILFGLIAHLLWLVFATAGITHSVIEVTNSLRDFWIGGYRLFWRFLRLTTYTLLIFIKSIINGQVAIIFAISQVLLLVRLTYKVANLKAIDIMIDVKTKVQRNSA